LTDGQAQLFITSGHATQKDWMIGYSYRNGFFVSAPGGKLVGRNTAGVLHDISSDTPRVHLGVGNCLIGDISDVDNCMALGLMHSAGVRQMVGYTVTSWYGYMGWGMLDYFYLQPGRYTVAEAFFANQQALLHRLETASPGVNAVYDAAQNEVTQAMRNLRVEISPAGQRMRLTSQDITGLLYDRDTVAIYGDPAWNVRMADGQNEWMQTLTESRSEGDSHEVTYILTLRKTAYDNTDRNGSQRGGRPIFVFLPKRLAQNADGTVDVEIFTGTELQPVIADDFVLIPKFEMEAEEYTVMFQGRSATP
jgi:zinc protease